MIEVLGYQYNDTKKYSPHLYVLIQEQNDNNNQNNSKDVVIRGRLISDSLSSTTNFASKFEDTNLDNQLSSTSALLQAGEYADKWKSLEKFKGRTLITKASTTQVWAGVAPQKLTVSLEFKAINDAILEVERPIRELLKIQSASLVENQLENTQAVIKEFWSSGTESELANTALGYTPNPIAISIASKYFNMIYFIEDISMSRDKIMVNKNGDRIYLVVELSLGSRKAITKDELI